MERTTIAIVGAGIAGLGAAKALEDNGFYDYILLEAQDYIGGRIKSIHWNDNWIEEGAQFLHGDQSQLGQICLSHRLTSEEESTEGEGIYIRNDGFQVEKHLIQEIDDLVKDTLEDCEKYVNETSLEDIPDNVGQLLTSKIQNNLVTKKDTNTKKLKEEIFDWNVRFLMIDNSCLTLDELSAKWWGKFRFVGGPEHLVFKDGYSSVVKKISEKLKNNNLRLNCPVKVIEWTDNVSQAINETENTPQVILTLNDKKIKADCVLVTCSLGFLKENHETFFSPRLPENLTLAIDSLGFGLINKVYLDFGEPWWQPGVEGFQLIWHESNEIPENTKLAPWTRDLSGFDVLEDHEAVLLGWVGGRGAESVEKLTEEEVANDCIELLRFFLKRDNLPAPKRCRRSQWGQNEWVRGSYSHISTRCDRNGITPKDLAEPVWKEVRRDGRLKKVPVIMIAGEAAHDSFYSTTHGAYESGRNQALKFLECIRDIEV